MNTLFHLKPIKGIIEHLNGEKKKAALNAFCRGDNI